MENSIPENFWPEPDKFQELGNDNKKQSPPSDGFAVNNQQAKLHREVDEYKRSLNPFIRDRGMGLITPDNGDQWYRKLMWTRLRTQVDCPFCGLRQSPAFQQAPIDVAHTLALPAYCRGEECAQGYDLFDQFIYDLDGNLLTSFPPDIYALML